MFVLQAQAQNTGVKRYLYGNEEIPGSAKQLKDLDEKEKPKLYTHSTQVAHPKDIVFLIIPGGAYVGVAIGHEGHDVANRLNELGYHAYVLDYRMPIKENIIDKRFGPLQDAQTAMHIIRKEHKGKKVAVLGFSAGGHLASTLSTFFNKPQVKGYKKKAIRPDYSVLCYPVISMEDGVTHQVSREKLIGPNHAAEDVQLFSTDKQVTKNNQPTFLMSAKDDAGVPIENSYRYQAALNKFNIPNTIFEYEKGGHGFGMINKTDDRLWLDSMIEWISNLKK